MTRLTRIATMVAMCLAFVPATASDDPPAKPKEKAKAKIEFRWLASKAVKDVTEEKGIQTSCGPGLMYPFLKPVLTNKDVAQTDLTNHDFSKNGLPGDHFMIKFHLTEEARKTLVAACGDQPGGMLAIFVDGRYWGTSNFQKADVAKFTPVAGFISSRAEAERIVEACK